MQKNSEGRYEVLVGWAKHFLFKDRDCLTLSWMSTPMPEYKTWKQFAIDGDHPITVYIPSEVIGWAEDASIPWQAKLQEMAPAAVAHWLTEDPGPEYQFEWKIGDYVIHYTSRAKWYQGAEDMDQEFGQSPSMGSAILRGGDQLARDRGQSKYDQEVAIAFYLDGADSALGGIVEFSRPQDFATRKAWQYHKLVALRFESSTPMQLKEIRILVHGYVDVPMSENDFMERIQLLVEDGLPIFHERRPLAPSDGIREDDFWDPALGEPTYWQEEDEIDDDDDPFPF